MKKTTACLVLILTALVAAPLAAQHGGEGGGESGGGCGDVFGDLIHVKRDAVTGQPILAQRWIDLPKELPYGWGYCPIAVDKNGLEIPFVALSCDPVDPTGTAVVPVDYFGRLSGGRTKERNSRMHFNEVISNIKMAGGVRLDETGRLQLGYTCTSNTQCAEWGVIDSPMENMALYTRLMKYGHFQTDPARGRHLGPRGPGRRHPVQPSARRVGLGRSSSPPSSTCYPPTSRPSLPSRSRPRTS